LASLGLLGLGQLDTSELDRLKQNWKEFQDNLEPMLEVVRKVQEFIGDDATLGAAIGYSILGLKGGIIGLIAGLVYDLTGSAALAAAAGGTSALLAYSTNARALVGKGAQEAGRSAYKQAARPTPTEEARFEVEKYPDVDIGNMRQNRVIAQEEEDPHSTPEANT
jgi:hypothetical protein